MFFASKRLLFYIPTNSYIPPIYNINRVFLFFFIEFFFIRTFYFFTRFKVNKNFFLKKKNKKYMKLRRLNWVRYSPQCAIRLFKKKKFSYFSSNYFDYLYLIKKVANKTHNLLPYVVSLSPLYFTHVILSDVDTLLSFHLLLQNYFFKIFKMNINFKFVNLSLIFSFGLLTESIRRVKLLTPRNLKVYYFTELTEILLSSFLTKQLFFFTYWYKNFIETRSFKIFSGCRKYLEKLLVFFIWELRKILKLKGFFVKFKGKFFKGGGRKKKIIVKQGVYSATQKSLRLVYKKIYIRTMSGVVGFSIKLAY